MYSINQERLLADFKALSSIGATEAGGVSRPALSEKDIIARNWLRDRINEAGLQYTIDGAGNQFGRLVGTDNTRTLLTGSHLDSVPNGGRYDGALGVLASLEAIRTLQDIGKIPPVSVELVNFTDEEGTLLGLFGSRAMIGKVTQQELITPRGGRNNLITSLDRAGLTEAGIMDAHRKDIIGYLELHIEQGKRLIDGATDIGIVSSMVGIRSYNLHFHGQAAHAGTTPMSERADALWAATDFIQKARQHVIDHHTPGVVNFGIIEAFPGAFNIVPGDVSLAMEFRHGSEDALDLMTADLLDIAYSVTMTDDLSVTAEHVSSIAPAPMDNRVIEAIEAACDKLDLSAMRLLSFAGHDAQSIAEIAPSGLLFVPSQKGISHNPAEYTTPDDMVKGANVLLHTLLALFEELV